MRVDVLGTVRVSDDDVAVADTDLGGRRARVLLVALALAGRPLSAEVLAGALWGEQPPPTWSAALRGTVRGLRTALAPLGGDGQRVVATHADGYCLGADVSTELHDAEAAVRRASALLDEHRFAVAGELAEPVAALRGRDLLPGEGAAWLAEHRAVVDALAARATDVVVRAASALGQHGRAVDAAQRAVAATPLDERAHRLLIRALHQAGDRAGAVRAYERCQASLADELGVDPSPETVAAYLSASATTTANEPGGRLPVPTTSFIGRATELAALGRSLDAPGLVTLVGAGGVGKSRLAVAAARRVDVAGGRLWVALGAAVADALVPAAVALGLGRPAVSDDLTAELGTHLAGLGRALVVLDAAEHVVDGVAALVTEFVSACPLLTVLVTSRRALDVEGERVIAVDPLPAPDPSAPLAGEQVQLVLDRVRAAGADIALDDPEALVELCRRCGGLPLALELVAAQLPEIPVADLLDQLDAEPAEHLRSIAVSSYSMLAADEAAVFRRLAVLDGPVGLNLLRPIVAGDDVAPARVVRILRELGARGLVVVDRSGPRLRYDQDDDVRRFAADLLAEHHESAASFARLADAVRTLVPDDAREPPGPFAAAVTDALGSVRALLRAGVTGAASADACLELAFRLHRYWAATSVAEGRYWLAALLERADASPWRRYATYALGYLGYWAGDTDAASHHLRAAIEQFDGAADPFVARAFIYVAGLLDDSDHPDEALHYVRQSIAAAEPFGTDLYVAAAMGMGSVLSERGDPSAAGYAADAVARCRVDGSTEQLSALLPTAAMICWQVGALDEAAAFVAEALPLHAEHKRIARVVLLSVSCGLALADGDVERAVSLGRSADAEATELGVEREMPLLRALLARALLRAGARADAAAVARSGVGVAAGMAVGFPLAIGLETAALLAGADGPTHDVAALLGAAATLRAAGDRPAPYTLRGELAGLPVGAPVSRRDAVRTACRVLDEIAGRTA